MSLTERQENILDLVIHEYLNAPAPVSSKTLTEGHGLGVSSATVRNEMAALEEYGLLFQPHTSAGRIPTETGYRYFVRRLLGRSELPGPERQTITQQFHQTQHEPERWLRLAAAILAQRSQSASVVTSPRITSNRYRHIVLIGAEGRLVSMVIVLVGGQVYHQTLTLGEPVPQEVLDRTADRLNELYDNLTAEEAVARAAYLNLLEREIGEHASEVIERADSQHESVIRDGLTNLITGSEFESEGARQTLRILEEREILDSVLADILTPDVEGVQVLVAGEGRWQELSHCSMILARYGVQGLSSGALAVVGPTRMDYRRAVATVRYLSDLMSDMLLDIYSLT